MEKKKGNALPAVLFAVAGIALIALVIMILMVLKVGPFAEGSAKEKERVLHTSANGIETMDNGYMRKDLSASELTVLMGNGINLGNTMEAYGRISLGTEAPVSGYETFWSQPVTTQEMITGMKNAGFDTLRIPVAWTNAMNYESGDYTIREDYLNRVEEIINYALNENMYVVINDHWDGSWWGMFGSASEETRQKAWDLYTSMWTQIAERYKEYSDYLIFESANEELGNRLNDTDVAADSGTLSADECYEMTLKINQKFVDIVRGTGGNNESRFLLIAGYNTDVDMTTDDRYIMPTDPANEVNKLILSVHYYTPWGYCGNESLSLWGTKRNYGEMNSLLESLTKFTDQGYGIIIGEYGVLVKSDGTLKKNAALYYKNFLDNCDLYNFCPLLWDCNNLYNRQDCKIIDDEIAALYKERAYANEAAMTDEEKAARPDKIKAEMDQAYADAPAAFDDDAIDLDDSTSVAWIMINSSDWNVMYSVGDVYDPGAKTDGLVATDVEITGEGTYTVSLDFTGVPGGYANGMAFSALAIGNGELLYPGYTVNITEVLVNGEPYTLTAKPYTTSDDARCTRVNLYNEWVTQVPDDARTPDGDTTGISPVIVDNADLTHMETLSITFEYAPGK